MCRHKLTDSGINQMSSARNTIRQTMRRQRCAVPPAYRHMAAASLVRRLATSPLFLRSRRIACYIASDGEMDLQPVMKRLWQMDKSCYLPVIDPLTRNRLGFAPYREGDPLLKNRFGIPEPCSSLHRLVPAWTLDLVLLPLVAFDGEGNRLGMGGG